MRISVVLLVTVAPFILLGACAPGAKQDVPSQPVPPRIGMPNPASVHCEKAGGRLDIRTRTGGGEYGVCVFNDGRQCEEWALFRDNRCVAPT
ncbi:putative hemolysin [Brevundimonas sp.]|uniref:putative hemolysin n=2 Tax=Brevundimonas sp. TaxID=1871086 RepID=UPI003FA57505